MAENYLITGYCGTPHVTAENDRGIHAGIFGAGRFVLPVGEQFRVEYVGNNTIRMYDGKLMDNGAAAGIPAGQYIDLIIPNASQGMNRTDLIAFQYSQDASTMIERGDFIVINGTETESTPADPQLTQQDLLSGTATLDQVALWRIPVSSTTVGEPQKLFITAKNMHSPSGTVVDATSEDGANYIASVDGVDQLYSGLEITIIPKTTSTTTAPTLNVNGLGAKPIRLSLSLNNSTLVQPENSGYYAAGRPFKVMFDSNYLSTGAWRVSNKQRPSATDLYGATPVPKGGTGLEEVTANSFLVGNGTESMVEKTPAEVRSLIGAVAMTSKTVTLSTSGWSSNKQTVSVSGVTASNTVIVTHAPDSFLAYTDAVIRCTAQSSGKLTFECDAVPTTAVKVNVLILN